jgi:hypothetical protein
LIRPIAETITAIITTTTITTATATGIETGIASEKLYLTTWKLGIALDPDTGDDLPKTQHTLANENESTTLRVHAATTESKMSGTIEMAVAIEEKRPTGMTAGTTIGQEMTAETGTGTETVGCTGM